MQMMMMMTALKGTPAYLRIQHLSYMYQCLGGTKVFSRFLQLIPTQPLGRPPLKSLNPALHLFSFSHFMPSFR